MGAVVLMGEMLSDGSWEAKETKFFPSKPGGAGAIIWPAAACCCWVGAPPVFGVVGRAWVVGVVALICSSMGGFISLGPLPESVLRSCFSRALWLFSPGAWIAAAGGCPPPGFWGLATRSGQNHTFFLFLLLFSKTDGVSQWAWKRRKLNISCFDYRWRCQIWRDSWKFWVGYHLVTFWTRASFHSSNQKKSRIFSAIEDNLKIAILDQPSHSSRLDCWNW